MEQEDYIRVVEERNSLREQLSKQGQVLENLKLSNLFLGAIFNGISEEIMVMDDDFNIIKVNRTFLVRHGLTRQDVEGKKCYEVKQHSGDPCVLDEAFCPLVRARKTGEKVEMTHCHQNAAGEEREVILIMYPLVSRRGKTKYFIELARDVTDYRVLLKKFKASEKRFRAILDTATDAILSIDENHNIILFNNAAQQIFEYSRDEVLGKRLDVLIPPHYGDHARFVNRFLKERTSHLIGKTTSLTALRKGGEKFPIELSLSFLEMAGEITFTAIIRDVSEQKRLENKLLQSERLAAVGHSAAHVAHELKSPLMIIGGFSNQINKSLTNDKDQKKVDMILEEVRRLERLVAELGDFTKEYRLLKRKADINAILRDVIKIMAGAYPVNKYDFKETFSPEVEDINCDPDRLKQVFINIITNGLEAMAEGGCLSITTERFPGRIEVRISDEGIGIPDEDLKHIFEPFYTTRVNGAGLGLSISYKIIEAHEGDLTAVSLPGKGTTIVVQLPIH
jgi:two-component system sensor kinase FixL